MLRSGVQGMIDGARPRTGVNNTPRVAPAAAGRAPWSHALSSTDQKALQLLVKRSREIGLGYDPETRSLGRYRYDGAGRPKFEPLGEGETQAFKERALNADSYRLGLKSPEELALDREIEAGPSAASTKSGSAPSLDLDSPEVAALLNRISMGEGTDDVTARSKGFPSGYDAIYYGSKIKPLKPLTQMTLREVDALQGQMRAGHSPSPVGKYQTNQGTLRYVARLMHLTGSEVYNPELQERIARRLLVQRHLFDYVTGRISDVTFQRRLNQEWASVADPATDDAAPDQHLGTTTEQIRSVMRPLRDSHGQPGSSPHR